MTTAQATHRYDRWADRAVVALMAIALLAGLVLRESVISHTTPFTLDEAGISGRYPAGWIWETGDDPVLRVHDPGGGEFNATLELRSWQLGTGAETNPLAVLEELSWERHSQLTAYRILDTDEVLIGEETAARRTFTYVHEDLNPYVDRLPVVVKGMDLALHGEDRMIVVTFLSSAGNFEADYHTFRAFLESLDF